MANSEIIGAGQDTARPAPKTEYPPVLDACCGCRAFWFNKSDKRAVYQDIRSVDIAVGPRAAYKNGKIFSIRPDICGTFSLMQFPNNTFFHVVFDPPHLTEKKGSAGVNMRIQYGQLPIDWRETIRRGFSECFRVLRTGGTLVFKWCEYEIPVSEILALTPEKPLYGHRSGKASKTHWVVFIKGEETPVLGEESPAQNTMEICHTAPNTRSLKNAQLAMDL